VFLGKDNTDGDSCNFDENGGGMDLFFPNVSSKRTIYW